MSKNPYYELRQRPLTLVDVLKIIERVPAYVSADTRTLMMRAFDEWEQKSPLVERVRRGETTFAAEYEELFHHRNGIGVLYPHVPPTEFQQTTGLAPRNYNERVKDAYAVFGGKELYRDANFANVAIGGGFGILGGGVIAGIVWLIDWMSGFRKVEKEAELGIGRRRFLGEVVGGLGLTFGALGGFCSLINYSNTKIVQQNAAYLDTKIQEAYR